MRWHADIPTLMARVTGFLVKRRGKSREDAQDLVQEAFLKMEQYCQRGNEVDCAEAFLKRTVMNLVVTEHRQEHCFIRGRTAVDGLPVIDPAPQPDEAFLSDQCLVLTEKILDRTVGSRVREIYFLHRLGGYSYADIAARYSCSVSMVEKHIANASAAITYERLYGQLRDSQ